MRYLSLIMLAVAMTAGSCISQKRCLKRFPPAGDTIKIIITRDTVIFRDTTIFIHLPGEIIVDSVLIPCPPPGDPFIPDTARAETSLSVAKAWWKYPSIQLQLVQKDTTIERRLRDAIREVVHWRSEYEKIKEVTVSKEIPGIYKYALGGWIGIIILIILAAILRSFKIF